MKRYTYIPVLSGGTALPEVVVDAESTRKANQMVWETLTEEQKSVCEYLDWVDTQDIPKE